MKINYFVVLKYIILVTISIVDRDYFVKAFYNEIRKRCFYLNNQFCFKLIYYIYSIFTIFNDYLIIIFICFIYSIFLSLQDLIICG